MKKKLAMIIFDALGINLIRIYKLKHLNHLYMNRNSQILTCSTYPHTNPSNIMIWSGENKNIYWVENKTDKVMDPASWRNLIHKDHLPKEDKERLTTQILPKEQRDDFNLIPFKEIEDLPWIWNILEANKYKARAVQLPIVLPPYSFNAVEETPDWFAYWEEGIINNLRDKERITMDSLQDLADDKIDFYCISFPQPDKLLHGVAEGHYGQEVCNSEMLYLDKVGKKIDKFCNDHNITYCIYGDHGSPRPQWDNVFGFHPDKKMVVVRHRNHSVIISNYKGKLPDYTDEIYQWMLKFYNITNTKIKKPYKKQETFTDADKKIVEDRLKKLGYM